MTTTPYATGRARADIERALVAAGKDIRTLQASELAMLEDFHSLGRLVGLGVFVPDFPAKAANVVRNLAENRARLIQAVVTAKEAG